MKLVFLDFDGVLNSRAYMIQRSEQGCKAGVLGIDPAAVTHLNRLVRAASAEVVVSSTWRHNRDREQLQGVLNEAGFVGSVRGRTPRWLHKTPGGIYAAGTRGDEIQAWLDAAPDYGVDVESFVIIDDDSDMAHLASRLVKTAFETGLTDADVDRALGVLTEEWRLVIPKQEAVNG